MSNKNFLNKNSAFVSSLVDFINDTKPFHAKLSEIVEEYQFYDNVNVKIEESLRFKLKFGASWKYNYFSADTPSFRTLSAQRVVEPAFIRERFQVGTQVCGAPDGDENTDLACVPYVYSKKSFDGPGVNSVYIQRADSTEALTESVDYFQSHGSFQFQIKQTKDANGNFNPLWAATNDDGLIAAARTVTRENALDVTDPTSAVRRIRALLDLIQDAIGTDNVPANTIRSNPWNVPLQNEEGEYLEDSGTLTNSTLVDIQKELDALYAIIDVPNLPQSYEALLAYLALLPHLVDFEQFKKDFSSLSSPLFFNQFSDLGLRNSGASTYNAIENAYIRVTNVVPNESVVEEWTLISVDDDAPVYRISGSISGTVGFVTANESFSSPKISFSTQFISQAPIGTELHLTPENKLVIHSDAALETWNIIKVNPIAHDRPQFISTRFGYIEDLNGKFGSVSLLNQATRTATYILTAISSSRLELTSTDSLETPIITSEVPFNNGVLAFTVHGTFQIGDRFYISIKNPEAEALNLDLGYGYDLDAFDNDHLVYSTDPGHENFNKKINFSYDGRFIDYDLSALELVIDQAAIHGRKWRIRALPDVLIGNIDLADATTGIPPDPIVPFYSMLGDVNPAEDLQLYYATQFSVEYSDNDFTTSTSIGNISVGSTFQSILHGIQFTLAPASRPFIAVSSDDGGPRVEGGDVFSFTVSNPLPYLSEAVGLTSAAIPRLIMHSDSFHEAPAAAWTIDFTSATEYTVSRTGTSQILSARIPTAGAVAREGLSFKGLGIHFTIVPTGEFAVGDSFTFNTFDEKPSYLVYGSVTGWTAPAIVGKWYWNGKIGFKLAAPEARFYSEDGLPIDGATAGFLLTRVRQDCPTLTYIFTKTSAGYLVTRTDVGIIGFAAESGIFEDQYITLELTDAQAELKLDIIADTFPLWNSADVIILHPPIDDRLPAVGEVVIVEKTETGSLQLNLVPSNQDHSTLNLITIDQRFIDLETHQDIPLSASASELFDGAGNVLLRGWLPLTVTKHDSSTSVAEFSDLATRYTFNSAASNETIGTLRQQGTNINEPIIFEWDADFYEKYLPLNAEANLVITGTGWNEKVNVRIRESAKFLIAGGALFEDFLFQDAVGVGITDDYQGGEPIYAPLTLDGTWTLDGTYNLNAPEVPTQLPSWRFKIKTDFDSLFSVRVEDSPFTGFSPGYGNIPYGGYEGFDEEYDVGNPPDLYSLLSRLNITEQERQDALDQFGNFLSDGEVPTTEAQWAYVHAAFLSDPNLGAITDDFGYPLRGLGLDITSRSTGITEASLDVDPSGEPLETETGKDFITEGGNSAKTQFQETVSILAIDEPNLYDTAAYDIQGIDIQSESTAILYSGLLPPVPAVIPPGTTYETLDSSLTTEAPARVFEILFNAAPEVLTALSPTFSIWLPEAIAPQQVPVLEQISLGRYRFSIGVSSAAKIIVT